MASLFFKGFIINLIDLSFLLCSKQMFRYTTLANHTFRTLPLTVWSLFEFLSFLILADAQSLSSTTYKTTPPFEPGKFQSFSPTAASVSNSLLAPDFSSSVDYSSYESSGFLSFFSPSFEKTTTKPKTLPPVLEFSPTLSFPSVNSSTPPSNSISSNISLSPVSPKISASNSSSSLNKEFLIKNSIIDHLHEKERRSAWKKGKKNKRLQNKKRKTRNQFHRTNESNPLFTNNKIFQETTRNDAASSHRRSSNSNYTLNINKKKKSIDEDRSTSEYAENASEETRTKFGSNIEGNSYSNDKYCKEDSSTCFLYKQDTKHERRKRFSKGFDKNAIERSNSESNSREITSEKKNEKEQKYNDNKIGGTDVGESEQVYPKDKESTFPDFDETIRLLEKWGVHLQNADFVQKKSSVDSDVNVTISNTIDFDQNIPKTYENFVDDGLADMYNYFYIHKAATRPNALKKKNMNSSYYYPVEENEGSEKENVTFKIENARSCENVGITNFDGTTSEANEGYVRNNNISDLADIPHNSNNFTKNATNHFFKLCTGINFPHPDQVISIDSMNFSEVVKIVSEYPLKTVKESEQKFLIEISAANEDFQKVNSSISVFLNSAGSEEELALKEIYEDALKTDGEEYAKELVCRILRTKATRDPFVLFRCVESGAYPLNFTDCVTPLDEPEILLPRCFGAASYDSTMKSCFTVSRLEPLSMCPPGFKIARTPGDIKYGPCKGEDKIPADPICDPPFALEEGTKRCYYNSTSSGHLGCLPIERELNSTHCDAARLQLRETECPPDYSKSLNKYGKGECTRTHFQSGNYLSYSRCPEGWTEVLNYTVRDKYANPLVNCTFKETIEVPSWCPNKTIPYYEYISTGNNPPVVFSSTFGDPSRVCVYLETRPIRPTCFDYRTEFPLILKGQDLPSRIPYNDLYSPIAYLETHEAKDFTKFIEKSNEFREVFYNDGNNDICVVCLSLHFAKPTLRCTKPNYVKTFRDPAMCKLKGHSNFLLGCPDGYSLDDLSLIFGNPLYPKPLCIGKLPAYTDHYCPREESMHLMENQGFIQDLTHEKCLFVRFSPLAFSPPPEIVDEIFPGLVKELYHDEMISFAPLIIQKIISRNQNNTVDDGCASEINSNNTSAQ